MYAIERKTDFEKALENLQPDVFAVRLAELRQKAQKYKNISESARAVSLIGTVLPWVLTANPITGIFGIFSGLAYTTVLITDYIETGKFHLFPGFRKSPLKIAYNAALSSEGEKTLHDVFEPIGGYLSAEEAFEFEWIYRHQYDIFKLLTVVSKEERVPIYKYIFNLMFTSGDMLRFPTINMVLDHINSYSQISEAITPEPEPKQINAATELLESSDPGTERYTDVDLWDSVSPPESFEVPEKSGMSRISEVLEQFPETDLVKTEEVAKEAAKKSFKDTLLDLPLRERMEIFLDVLESEGFPLRSLIQRPFIVSNAPSQSGKSTIIHLLSLARLAYGISVEYSTPDDDIPEINFNSLNEDWQSYKESVNRVTNLIANGSKGSLSNSCYVFDELYRSAQYGINSNPMTMAAIQKGDKTGVKLVYITQDFTLKALKLESVGREALDSSVTMILPEISYTREGKRIPAGRYRISNHGTEAYWEMPAFLRESRDPVGVMLEYFPELVRQSKNIFLDNPIQNSIEFNLEPVAIPVSSPAQTPSQSETDLENLKQYLQRHNRINLTKLKKNWGRNRGLTSEQVDSLLKELSVQIENGVVIR